MEKIMSFHESKKLSDGGVAQLGEHLPCKQGVMSSNLTISIREEISEATGKEKKRNRDETLFNTMAWYIENYISKVNEYWSLLNVNKFTLKR